MSAPDLFPRLEPSGGASGQASDIAIHAKEILRVRSLLTEIYQRHCGKDGETKEVAIQRFGLWELYIFPLRLTDLG